MKKCADNSIKKPWEPIVILHKVFFRANNTRNKIYDFTMRKEANSLIGHNNHGDFALKNIALTYIKQNLVSTTISGYFNISVLIWVTGRIRRKLVRIEKYTYWWLTCIQITLHWTTKSTVSRTFTMLNFRRFKSYKVYSCNPTKLN